MNITLTKIKSLNPCGDRLDNFVKYYPKYSNTIHHFLGLKHATFSDKIWVATKVLSRDILVEWSIRCAESVLPIYEAEYPDDPIARICIETTRTVNDNINEISDAAYASYASGYAANAAYYAANAAYYAAYAAYAANAAATDAANAAAYAAYASGYAADVADAAADADAADASGYAGENLDEARKKIVTLLKTVIKEML